MNNFIALIVLISILHCSQSQVPGLGRCPSVSVVQNFDVARYSGLWYEVQKYPFLFSIGARCITARYTLNADSTVKVENSQIRNGEADSVVGTATIVTPGVGTLTVSFPDAPITFPSQEGNYNVLYTDYEDLAVVYNCGSFLGLLNVKFVWILSRKQFPSTETIEKAYEVLRDNGVSTIFLSKTNQNNCPEQVLFNAV